MDKMNVDTPYDIVQEFRRILRTEIGRALILQSEDSVQMMTSFLTSIMLKETYPGVETFFNLEDISKYPVMNLFNMEDSRKMAVIFRQVLFKNKVKLDHTKELEPAYRKFLMVCENYIIHVVTHHGNKNK